MNKLKISISSEIRCIVKVESFIESFMDHFHLTEEVYGRVSLAVIEAVNNAILSGNKKCADKLVVVRAEMIDNRFFISVQDEGEGFNYSYIPDPTTPENVQKDTGRGLYIMKTLSDGMIFENGGSKVTLIFNL